MIAETQAVETAFCPSCGNQHDFPVALVRRGSHSDTSSAIGIGETLFGFFALCPVRSERTWYVIGVADSNRGRPRALRVLGEPKSEREESSPPLRPLGCEVAELPPSIHHARTTSGARWERPADWEAFVAPRSQSRVPEMLRRTLGCPHFR